MLVLVFIMCMALAWVGEDLARYRREKAVVDRILACGGRVSYEHQTRQLSEHGLDYQPHPEGNPVFRFLFGDHLYSKVDGVRIPSQYANQLFPDLHKLPGIVMLGASDITITDHAIEGLVRMPNLGNVFFGNVEISPEQIRNLAKSQSLTSLSLQGTSASDQNLKQCGHFEQLHRIYLTNSVCTSEGIAALADVATLNDLQLRGLRNSTSVKGLRHLTSLKHFNSLTVRYSDIEDQALVPIGKLFELEYLELDGNQITDEGLRLLQDLDHLKQLSLVKNPITDEGIKSLQALESLQEVHVTQSNQVTLDRFGSFTVTKFKKY